MEREVFSISTNDIFLSSLRHIERQLEPFKKDCDITTEIVHSGGRHQLSVALGGFNRGQVTQNDAITALMHKVIPAMVDAIADVIITDCKYYYIESSIKLSIQDEISRHAFIRALSNFDRTQDLCIAKSLINLTPNFLLDSFYTFSLDVLKERWQEVCELANENACYLMCDGTLRELLRFLISNLESRYPEVHLFQRADKVEVLASNLKPVNVYVNDELSQDSQVISTLISIAPKRIFCHVNAKPSPILDFIRELFRGCIMVEQR